MKKLLSCFFFLAFASAVLTGCASNKYTPKKTPVAQAKKDKVKKPSVISSFVWKYQVTPNKLAKLGVKGQEMAVETLKARVQLTAPSKWKIVSCVDEPLDWYFVSAAPDATLAFGWKVVSFAGNPPLQERFQNYLDGIHRAYDATVQMLPQQNFSVGGHTVPSYLYYSGYWGQRLVIIISQKDISTVLEFSGPAAASFQASHGLIQKILNSYSFRKL